MVQKWIRWIVHINGRFQLNFDGPIIQNISVLSRVIKGLNGTIKMVISLHLDDSLIIIIKYMTSIYDVLSVKNNGFFDRIIEGFLKQL